MAHEGELDEVRHAQHTVRDRVEVEELVHGRRRHPPELQVVLERLARLPPAEHVVQERG